MNLHAPLEALAEYLFLDVQNSWQAQHFVNLHVQNSWQAQHFVNLHAPLEALAVALSAVVAGGRRSVPPL